MESYKIVISLFAFLHYKIGYRTLQITWMFYVRPSGTISDAGQSSIQAASIDSIHPHVNSDLRDE